MRCDSVAYFVRSTYVTTHRKSSVHELLFHSGLAPAVTAISVSLHRNRLPRQLDQQKDDKKFLVPPKTPRNKRASLMFISQSLEDVQRMLSPARGAETKVIEMVCCGGGCCFLKKSTDRTSGTDPRLCSTFLAYPMPSNILRQA